MTDFKSLYTRYSLNANEDGTMVVISNVTHKRYFVPLKLQSKPELKGDSTLMQFIGKFADKKESIAKKTEKPIEYDYKIETTNSQSPFEIIDRMDKEIENNNIAKQKR